MWARAAGVALLLIFFVLAFRSGDAGSWLGGSGIALAVGVGFVALSKWPAGSAFVLRHPRSFVVGGIGFAIVGFCAFLIAALSVPNISDSGMNAAVAAASGCLLVGTLVAFLPSTVKRVQASRTELAAVRPDAEPGKGFEPIREATRAWRSVATGWPVLLRIVGPWLAIQLMALVLLGYSADHLDHDQRRAALLLLCLAVLVIGGLYVVLPTIAVRWFRWVLSGERPASFLVLPTRGVFSLAWRLWLFLSVLGTVDSMIQKQVQSAVAGSAGATAAEFVSWIVFVGAIALASSVALRFPAIATQDETFTQTAALVQGRRMWPGLPLGLLLSLAPFLIVGWAAQALVEALIGAGPHHPVLGSAQVIEIAIELLLLSAALASGASFLSRAYLRAKSTM